MDDQETNEPLASNTEAPSPKPESNPDTHLDETALRQQMLRLAADFDNFRKRSQREQEDLKRFGIERFARALLPVVDNLERALQYADDTDHALLQGVRMVVKQFTDVFASYGVVSFVSQGEIFNPNIHEALSEIPSTEQPPGTVVQEVQRGYMIYDKLLRPAQVLVASQVSSP